MDAELIISSLLPVRWIAVIKLVEAAGVDISSWGLNKEGDPVKVVPGKNPNYCFNWSFGDNAGPVVFNIWHKDLRFIGGRIFCDDNMLNKVCKGKEKISADEFNRRIAYSFEHKCNVRVIILARGNKSKLNRLLDEELWHVESYDSSGNFRLTRGAMKTDKNQYFDQFSIANRHQKVEISGSKFVRSRDVRDVVLRRAGGVCEYCGTPGFLTANGGFYLETHHVIQLSEGGADLPSNVVAICATDHRKAHHAEDHEEIRANLLAKLALLQKNAEF